MFDGVCNFCNYWVQFTLRRNRSGSLQFGTLQGQTARRLLPQYGLNPDALNTLVFISNGKAYTASNAVLEICRHLDGAWRWLAVLKIVPRFLRDAVYRFIARNRYRWFGKRNRCMVPAPAQQNRFVD